MSVVEKIFPKGSKRRNKTKQLLVKVGLKKVNDLEYSHWVENIEQINTKEIELPSSITPRFSIVLPTYNTPQRYIEPLIDSVIGQIFQDWELIIADGSDSSKNAEIISYQADRDERIKYYKINNQGISGNTNQAINKARGNFIIFMDHDDTLAPHSLNEVARVLLTKPDSDLIYSDEDKLSENGEIREKPHLKTDFDIHLLRNLNYITHLVAVRHALLKKVGGLKPQFDGVQDYEFLLRVVDQTDKIEHIPKVLYHWRQAVGSTAEDFSAKQNLLVRGERALKEHLARNNLDGEVKAVENMPGYYQIFYSAKNPNASIIIWSKSIVDVENIIQSLSSKEIKLSEIILPKFLKVAHIKKAQFKQIDADTEAEFFREAIKLANHEKIVLINRSVVLPKNWLTNFSGVIDQNHNVAGISPQIISENERIIDMGYFKNRSRSLELLFYGLDKSQNTYYGDTNWVRQVKALTGRFVMIRKSLIEKHIDYRKANEESYLGRTFFLELTLKHNLTNLIWTHVVASSTVGGHLIGPSIHQSSYLRMHR